MRTSIIGRKVRPAPGLERLWPLNSYAGSSTRDVGLEDLAYTEATIIAAWTVSDKGKSVVMIATVGPAGETREFSLTHVRLVEESKKP